MTLKSDTGPFAMVPDWLLHVGLSSRAIHLYVVLSRFADKQGTAWPTRTTLAERLGCKLASLDRALVELKQAEALSVQARIDKKGQHSNLYVIHRVDPSSLVSPPLLTDEDPPSSPVSPITRTSERDTGTTYLCGDDAESIVDEWWRRQVPRPAQPYIAIRKVVANALKGGWEPDVLRRALDEVATVSGSTLDYWLKRDRTRSKSPGERSRETLLRVLAESEDDEQTGSGNNSGTHAGELVAYRRE